MLYDAGFGRLYVKNCKHNWQWTAGAPPFGKGACLDSGVTLTKTPLPLGHRAEFDRC